MDYTDVIFLLLATIPLYLGFRNFEVHKFRMKIIDLDYKWAIKNSKYQKFFDKLPSYSNMVLSFKRLKLENYFTKEEINELLNT